MIKSFKVLCSTLLTGLLFTSFLFCESWSLQDPNAGWNSRELVTLYHHNSEPQTQWAWHALSNYKFQGTERVLDFGSGDGKLSALMSFMVPQGAVTGVDLSKEMTLFATEMFPYSKYLNLQFLQSSDVDFAKTSFDEKFDLVTSFCTIQLVPHPRTVFKEIKEKMKPNGHFVGTFPLISSTGFYMALSEQIRKRGWELPKATEESSQMRDLGKISDYFTEAGFNLLHFKVAPKRTAFASKEELIDWFEGIFAATLNIPTEGRREFFIDLANSYIDATPEDVGSDGMVYFSVALLDFVVQARAND